MIDTPRKYEFDFVRAICMIWIVFIWHLNDYLPTCAHFPEPIIPYLEYMTQSALACFTFISGYLLQKYRFDSIQTIGTFYKKRFLRFYGLYVIAALCFVHILDLSWHKLLYLLLGVSLYMPEPAPFTLWYMCMLMSFYIITPIIKYKYSSKIINAVIVLAIILASLYGYSSRSINENVVLYLPFYLLGLFYDTDKVWYYLATFIMLVFIGVLGHLHFMKVISILGLGCSAIVVFSFNFYMPWMQRVVYVLSYSSFCIYLFHRVIFYYVAILMGNSNGTFLPQVSFIGTFFLVISTFLLSYAIQYTYDALIRFFSKP